MRKKVIVLGVIFLALILLFVLFVFMGTKKPNNQQGGSNNPQNSAIGTTQAPQQENPGNPSAPLYTTPYYQISYPNTYSQAIDVPQQGILSGMLLTDNQSGTQIETAVFDNSKTSFAQLSQIAQSLGYAKSTIKVGQYTADSYSGSMQGAPAYEQIVLLQKNNTVVKLQLIEQGGPTQKAQDDFNSILKSFE